uniref:Uncharacterized protein n=1 Tax=Hyaloperonospora arabidopsidis (strain Emoy2) TaxID=559515 RepID=M4B4V1_HYAAE
MAVLNLALWGGARRGFCRGRAALSATIRGRTYDSAVLNCRVHKAVSNMKVLGVLSMTIT